MSELRALQVVRPAAGGMVRHVAALSSGLRERGIAVTVAAPKSALESAGPLRLEVDHDLPIGPRFRPIQDARSIAMLRRLSAGFHVVHAHGLRAAWIAAFARSRTEAACIATAHNMPDLHGLPARVAARMALRRADVVIAVSHAVANQVASLGADRRRIHVIPNGVPIGPRPDPSCIASNRRDLGLPPDAFVILAAGRLSPEKGFDVLVSAMPRIIEEAPGAILAVVGAGPAHSRLTAQIARLGLEPTVRLVGFVPDVAPWLGAADVVVVPSRSEGQGLVALEAMALGVPVVASRVGGLPEVVSNGVTGLLTMPDDPDALAEAVIALARDSELRTSLGWEGRKRAEDAFSIEAMLNRISALYRAVAKGAPEA